jgi:hypothetical protein
MENLTTSEARNKAELRAQIGKATAQIEDARGLIVRLDARIATLTEKIKAKKAAA